MRMIDSSEATAIIADYFDAICDTEYTFDEAVLLKLLNDKAVDAVPAKHGRWMPREEGKVYPFWERYTCSVCGEHASYTNYCPNCGARMDEE